MGINLIEVEPEQGKDYVVSYGPNQFVVHVERLFTLEPSGALIAECTSRTTNRTVMLLCSHRNRATFYRMEKS